MLQVIAGAVMLTGGGLLTASSVALGQMQRRRVIGAHLRAAFAPAVDDTIPADQQQLLDRIP